MSKLFTGTASFLNGLSDLWLRFFKDKEVLEALYRGAEVLVGQAYLDLVSNVLNVSMREVPVFNKELFRLLTIREDQVTYDITHNYWVFQLPESVKDFQYLYNKIFSPTTILEKGLHFEIDTSGEYDELRFKTSPFDWEGSGLSVPGVAERTIDVIQDDGTTAEKRQLAFWIPDAQVDHYNLYLTYGYLLGRFEPSSESFRALLRGISQYFTLGPTPDRITSALNITVGLPLVRDDGEVLQEVTLSDGIRYVKTDKQTYEFDALIPLREDVLDSSNWGKLAFTAFEYLTLTFIVQDWISAPTWWYEGVVPEALLPDEAYNRRVTTPEMYANLINNPEGLVKIGDPGFFIGADDDGFVPTGRNGLRHLFSFVTFERFLRYHTFKVDPDTTVFTSGVLPFPRSERDISQIIVAGSSAYTYLYLNPEFMLEDHIHFLQDGDGLYVVPKVLGDDDILPFTDGGLIVTTRSWKIGDYYRYGTGAAMVVDNPETGDPFGTHAGDTHVVIGGSDPTHLTHRIADDEGGTNLGELNSIFILGQGMVQRFILPTGRFRADDVGKWLRVGTGPSVFQIQTVVSSTMVYLYPTGFFWHLHNQVWSLWNNENDWRMLGYGDWPVQVRVIP